MALVAAAACGGDGDGPVTPATLLIVSGNGQSGFANGVLTDSLVVRVLGSDGDNMPGVTVTFSASGGSATLSPQNPPTDADGLARTQVTLAGTVGPLMISAAVSGLVPVQFNATGVSACQHVIAHAIGTSSSGTLTSFDCSAGGYFTDLYGFTLPAQQAVTITESAAFDAWMDLVHSAGTFILAYNDDDPTNATTLNSRIDITLAPGTFVVGASSLNAGVTGAYTLSSAARGADVAGCELMWASRGVSLTGVINLTDCRDSVAAGLFYSDFIAVAMEQGDTLRTRLASAAFDPFVTFIDAFRDSIVASNDDSAGGVTTTAYATWIADSNTVILVDLGTKNPGENGAYTATFPGSVTAGALRIGGRAGIDYGLSRSEFLHAPSRALGRRSLRLDPHRSNKPR